MASFRLHYASRWLMSATAVLTFSAIESTAVLRLVPAAWQADLIRPKPGSFAHALSVVLVIVLLNLTLAFGFKCLIYNNFIAPLRSFPRPEGRNFFTGWFASALSRRRLDNLFEWATEPGNTEEAILFRTAYGVDRLLITGPRALQEILVTNPYDWHKPPPGTNFLREILGDGLIVTEGDAHKWQRKQVKPAFGFRQIKDLYPMMWSKTLLGMDCIAGALSADGTGSVEIGHWANKIALDIIGVAGLGRDLNTLFRSDDPLAMAYDELLEPGYDRFVYFVLRLIAPTSLVESLPWKMNETWLRTTEQLRVITNQMVLDKRESIREKPGAHNDILALLINNGNFSDHDLAQQLLTILAAGHDTTTATFMWTVFQLAQNEEIQRQVRKEVSEALVENGEIDVATSLDKLPLLHGVLQEGLRLHPAVAYTKREARHATSIMGRPVPADTGITLAPWVTNKMPSLWGPDAGKFNPQRWISNGVPNNSGGVDNNYSFLTFLHGPRSCIGQGFARTELKCLLAAFLRRFEWALDMKPEDVVPSGVITVKPMGGLKIRLRDLKAGSSTKW